MCADLPRPPSAVHIGWKIRCVRRATKEFFDRYLVLEWNLLSDEQEAEVLSVANGRDWTRILPYRSYFREIEEEELLSKLQACKFDQYFGVSVPEYFEDEFGVPLDAIGMIAAVTGDPYPVILGNVKSVLRLGPSKMLRSEQWSCTSANQLVHFLSITRRIWRSRWLHSNVSISWNLDHAGKRRVVGYDAPDEEKTLAMLLQIRQLISSDNVFRKACKKYCQHVDDVRKRDWVDERRKSFGLFIEMSPAPNMFRIRDLSVREIIDLIFYGTGYIHCDPNSEQQRLLREVLEEFGSQYLMTAFNASCHDVASYALNVAPVFEQDLANWILTKGIAKADVIDTRTLF